MLSKVMDYEIKYANHSEDEAPCHWVVTGLPTSKMDSFAQEYANLMAENKLRVFHGLDRYLFFTLDGTLSQIKYVFGCIASAAVYDNYFEGVLAFDLTELLLPRNRMAAEYFCKTICQPQYSLHANFLFFVDDVNGTDTGRVLGNLSVKIRLMTCDVNESEVLSYAK